MKYQCHPEWVFVEGAIHHVSDYAHLKAQDRPNAICPACKRPVTMKLGNIRVHHFAHQPDSACVLTNPETAVHFNMKHYIANQLKNTSTVLITQSCISCENSQTIRWVSDWDDIQIEYTVDLYRPDIALLREGIPIGAIEVLVTHTVEPDKASYYRQKFIRWIEVQGTESFYQGKAKWTSDQPLPYMQMSKEIPDWVCEDCQKEKAEAEARAIARKKAEEARQKEAKARAEYEVNIQTMRHSAMLIDFYFPSGKTFRDVFYTYIQIVNGMWKSAYVETHKEKKIIGKIFGNPIDESQIPELDAKVKNYLNEREKKHGAVIDIVVDRQKWEAGSRLHPKMGSYRKKYRWDEKDKKWY
jgi:hypothetical protein